MPFLFCAQPPHFLAKDTRNIFRGFVKKFYKIIIFPNFRLQKSRIRDSSPTPQKLFMKTLFHSKRINLGRGFRPSDDRTQVTWE